MSLVQSIIYLVILGVVSQISSWKSAAQAGVDDARTHTSGRHHDHHHHHNHHHHPGSLGMGFLGV